MALRIAHVLSSFALGGQERVALDLAGAQVALGHTVVAVSLAPLPHGVLGAALEARGVTLHAVPKGSGFDPRTILRLAKLLRSERIDVVHTHNPQPLAYGAPAARLARAAIVHTKHGVNPGGARQLWLRRAGGHLVDAYVAVSDATAKVARANHECLPGRLHVIPNGVDLEAYRPDPAARIAVRRELAIPEDAFVFGTVGRVSVEKDHALLVRAAGPLLGPDRKLVVVGDGAELANVRAAAVPYAENVVFTGARHDVPRIVAAFDAFVLSSRTEGLPLALLEAMATELPIAATDVGGVREVVGDTALLVPPRDEAALRGAMKRLSEDPDRARALATSARVRAGRYDAHVVVERYMQLYGEFAR